MKKETLLEFQDKLREMKLPPHWKVSKLEVTFRREGTLGEFAEVIYWDYSGEPTFYVKTNKAIVYPDDVKALREAIEVMDEANKIIGSKRKST